MQLSNVLFSWLQFITHTNKQSNSKTYTLPTILIHLLMEKEIWSTNQANLVC